jgi:hypothetical protein
MGNMHRLDGTDRPLVSGFLGTPRYHNASKVRVASPVSITKRKPGNAR